eukprot:XP_008181038.1 PREDICTED: uncharacterized protein LOC100570714 [Acyrthosiphon pisum]
MSHKIIDSLRTLANETIAVQELLKGDIPQEEESQNSSKLNNTRHDDNGKASLAIQQPKSHTEESWLNQMLIKIIGSLRTSANETIAVQELIKEDIPRKEESQNSSELTASEQPKSLEILTTTTTIDPMLVDELQDPTNPFNLGQGYGNLHLSKPVVYEPQALEANGNYVI